MNRLCHLILTEDPKVDDMLYARRLAIEVFNAEKPVGLPSHMWEGARESAYDFLEYGNWLSHIFLCLILVQARRPDMKPPEILARLELERIAMNILFGFIS